MSHYTTNDRTAFSNDQNSFNVSNIYTVTDDRSQILAWLSPLDPGLRHWDIQERRVKDIGEWLMQTEEFRRWSRFGGEGEGNKAVLFCYGDPGVGKTFMSSLVVDRLCDLTRGQNTAVTCFYFDFAARKEQSTTNMLGSLLNQMICGMGNIPEKIWRALREQKEAVSGRRPQLIDIVKMLKLVTSSQCTYMCIDALDECAVVQRFKLFDSLQQILERSPGARIFVTGRPHIRAEIERRLAGQVTSVSISPTNGDVLSFLRARLNDDETPDAMDESLEADILENIPRNISEMFLLVSLNIEAILQESTIHRRRERLSKITDGLGLGDAYNATIERIKAQEGDKSRLGMEALMWISHAERPLRLDELCHALATELGSTDFHTNNIPSITTLVGCCQGLITVDKETSTIRLIHFTLQEYLSANPDIFVRTHSTMAEICLTYLKSQQVKELPANPFYHTRDTPFLEYSSVYWGVHAKRELSECARSLALELLQEYNGHISAERLLEKEVWGFDFDTDPVFNGLHCASLFGIAEVLVCLIEMECYDLNERDFRGSTPLLWAAKKGHEEVVKILLERKEINPEKQDNWGQTPLWHAARSGHAEAVKMLLYREEVNPDKPDDHGNTPLSIAAQYGHENVVEILLRREEVNPEMVDNDGDTPLSCAAYDGHEGVVKILLRQDGVNPDTSNDAGQTPLSIAAQHGHSGVVKILLEQEMVNPNKADNDGQTPLLYAARYGYQKVIELLQSREAVACDTLPDLGDTIV